MKTKYFLLYIYKKFHIDVKNILLYGYKIMQPSILNKPLCSSNMSSYTVVSNPMGHATNGCFIDIWIPVLIKHSFCNFNTFLAKIKASKQKFKDERGRGMVQKGYEFAPISYNDAISLSRTKINP